jgi:c-di-GMP-binding flagellar brake protein YcgR
MNKQEHRRHGRYACTSAVEIEWGSEILRALIRDISKTGMFVVTNDPLWMRAEFSAKILHSEPVQVICIVKRVEPGRGMGVEFTEVPEDSLKLLEEFLWKLARK